MKLFFTGLLMLCIMGLVGCNRNCAICWENMSEQTPCQTCTWNEPACQTCLIHTESNPCGCAKG